MKIGIVSGQPEAARALQRSVVDASRHQVVWVAASGTEAVDLCARLTPDLVLLDLLPSEMTSAETTRRIMAGSPCAILIVTDSLGANAGRVFEAMGFGALDAVDVPALDAGNPADFAEALMTKIDFLARVIGETARDRATAHRRLRSPFGSRSSRLVAIGASAGGPAAIATILRGLPKDFPAAVTIVQHVDGQFAPGLAAWLGESSNMPVRIALEGDQPEAGVVLVAGSGDHLVLTSPDRLGYSPEPRQHVYRPSIDVFFESICRMWCGDVVGVLLTGMGRDGALGLKALRDQGRYTIAQDEGTSALYGMPKAAATLKAATAILPIDGIAARLVDVVASGADRVGLRRPG